MLSDAVRNLGLGSDAVVEPASRGASGAAWIVRTPAQRYVLRLSSPPLTEGRVAAMAVARASGLPAPELIRRAASKDGDILLLSWLPGSSLYDTLLQDPAATRRWGRAMGEMQRRLHQIAAPSEVVDVLADGDRPFVAGRGARGLPPGNALLHLDWHPFNLLVDEAGTRISGIVDWDNARRGHPLLDLARTHSLLSVEPSMVSLPQELRARIEELVDAWEEGYGPEAREIPPACHAWAGQVMLADLEARFAERPVALDELRGWTRSWEADDRSTASRRR